MNDLFQPVRDFESKMADFTGFEYGVAVESCSAALFLCCLYKQVARRNAIKIPAHTYPSVPASINNAGGRVEFCDDKGSWQETGFYPLGDTGIYDSARYVGKNMSRLFWKDHLVCLSFHARKCLPIGRGGMVLTNDKKAVEWLKKARHDGRTDGISLADDTIEMIGWNMLMTPEQASRGLTLLGNLQPDNSLDFENYPDLSKAKIWRK